MAMKSIRKLEDIEEINKDDFAEVHTSCQTSRETILLVNYGIFYERLDNGFSVIEPIITSPPNPEIGRVLYQFNPEMQQYDSAPNQVDFPFKKESEEYQKYEHLLIQLNQELEAI